MRRSSKGRRIGPGLLCALAALAAGCSGNAAPDAAPASPAGAAQAAGSPPPASSVSTGQTGTAPGRTSADIPPDYVPPPGMCRVWVPGEPADEEASRFPVGRCSTLRQSLPEDAWLIYRPTDDSGRFRAWQYDGNGQVRAQRLYDLATGRLIRHIAPASGN